MTILWPRLGSVFRFRSFSRLFCALILMSLSPGALGTAAVSAQDVSLPRLATLKHESTYPDGFAYLSGVRELPDGKVMVADPLSGVFVRVDFDQRIGDTLGRVGEGPQEYRQPDRAFAFPGDSTLLVDLGNGRLIVVDPLGIFTRWSSMSMVNAQGRSRTLQPSHVDGSGKLYAYSLAESPPGDSTYMGRFDLETGEEGIAARLWHPDFTRSQRAGGRPMLISSDGMAVGKDGRVAVVRANGYSVEWFYPDGRVAQGPEHPAERYPVGEGDRAAEVELMMEEAVFGTVQAGGGEPATRQLRRGVPASARAGLGEFSWPDELPVFRAHGVHVSPENRVWVERVVPVGSLSRMEVFDGDGVRRGFVELPVGGRLLGFGNAGRGGLVAYVARTDATGLKWLERHRVAFEES